MNKARQSRASVCRLQSAAWMLLVCLACLTARAETVDNSAATNSTPSKADSTSALASRGLDESTFSLVSERNIFNANRSGGQVRLASRRTASVESFTLVGTMAYEKGTYAFFDGSSSEYTKALKADSVIAGHKVVSIQTSSVKLEAEGKQFELLVGSQMRREDAGLWHMAEAAASNSGSSSYSSSGRNGRSGRGDFSFRSRRNGGSSNGGESSESTTRQTTSTAEKSSDSSDQNEILKRLMERREKESQ